MNWRKLELFFFYLMIIFLVIRFASIVYLTSAHATIYSEQLYQEQFEKNAVYEYFEGEHTKEEIDQVNSELLAYLNPLNKDNSTIESAFFNEKEKIHLVEVKDLLYKIFACLMIGITTFIVIFLLLIYDLKKLKEKHIGKVLLKIPLYGSVLIIAAAGVFAIMMKYFETFFIKFHLLFFKTDTWIMDPATDKIIHLFPEQFFSFMFGRIVATSLVVAFVVIVLIIYHKWYASKADKGKIQKSKAKKEKMKDT